jgi:hypothetical protein
VLRRQADRFPQPWPHAFANHDAIDHRFDGVILLLGQRRHGVDLVTFAVDASPHESRLTNGGEDLRMFSAASAHHRRQDHDFGSRRQRRQTFDDVLRRLLPNRGPAAVTTDIAQTSDQQP